MARNIKVSAAVMNVRIHPHDDHLYVQLFREVFRLKAPAQVHGDRYGLISTANFSRVPDGIITGVVTTFTKLEMDGWFDVANLQDASVDQISAARIPAGLFPNAATYFFHFKIRTHRLYFETYSRGKAITPISVQKFLRGLLGHPKLVEKFNEPSISIVQTKEGLRTLFSIDRIRKIEITLEKPNADIFSDDFEEEIEKHLKDSNTQKMTVTYEAESGKSVVATSSIRKVGEAAIANGEVTVTGRDKGVAVVKSSSKFPKVLQDKYDPELTSEQQAFDRLIPGDD